jgi:hypothetical protein
MKARIMRVVFEADVHRDRSRFQIPSDAVGLLGLPRHGPIALVIKDVSGKSLYAGIQLMASKYEVYGPDMDKHIKPGQTILVELSRP